MGMILFGIGLVGEYVGRIYQQVRARPRYVIATVLQGPILDKTIRHSFEKRHLTR